MMPVSNIGTRVPLQIRCGADFSCLLTFTNPNATALDLTNCTLAAEMWRDDQFVASFTVIPSTPPTLGTAQMSLSAADTLAIAEMPGSFDDDSCAEWEWGLSLTDSTGKVSSLLYGPVQLFPALVVA